jgi:hypothetical protein
MLYWTYVENADYIQIYCSSTVSGGFQFLRTEYAGNYPLNYKITGESLAYFDADYHGTAAQAGPYQFQVQGQNYFGSGGRSPAASIPSYTPMGPPGLAQAVSSITVINPGPQYGYVLVNAFPLQVNSTYAITIGGVTRNFINGMYVSKTELTPGTSPSIQIDTSSLDGSIATYTQSAPVPQASAIVLDSASYDPVSQTIKLVHFPIRTDQGTAFKVKCDGTDLPGIFYTYGTYLSVPRGTIATGSHTFSVYAVGNPPETGADSNTVTLPLP